MFYTTIILVTCVKLLLTPAYHSTDFEVHRNWLAITHNLPVRKWYFENTSEWTLDYPPIFAWFEYMLSFIAQYFDRNMLIIENLNYASSKTILFQRLSVIFTDLVYAYGVKECCSFLPKSWQSTVVLPVLLLTNIGLLMVDHIHFQYNGIMFGILLLSIAKIQKEEYVHSAFWFALLLNMKHIFIYMAPAYFIFLFRNYCWLRRKDVFIPISIVNLFKLGTLVLSIFFITYIPFYGQLHQVFSRMFPFKRGLCHAYWAPNIWAVYNICDKILAVIARRLHWPVEDTTGSMTGGLVQEYSYAVLPNITPIITVILTAIFMTPGMIRLWHLGRSPFSFIRYLVICALTSFLFGWHVHEKAILMAIIPLSILAIVDAGDARIFLILSTIGFYSLFPLLYPNDLLILKVTMFITYCSYAFYSLRNLYPLQKRAKSLPLLNRAESAYVFGLIFLFLFEHVIHPFLNLNIKLPFLPLMMTSTYCSIGVIYSWVRYYISFVLRNKEMRRKCVK